MRIMLTGAGGFLGSLCAGVRRELLSADQSLRDGFLRLLSGVLFLLRETCAL